MATISVSTDTNYSALAVGPDDIIQIFNGAVLTVDTSTEVLRQWRSTIAGEILVQNASTTTPIFLKVAGGAGGQGRLRFEYGSHFNCQGGLIQIGTSDGTANQTFTLPQDANGDDYLPLGGLFVDHGDSFRDLSAFYRAYCRADDLVDAFGDDRFGLVFTQTGSTITFGDNTNGHIPPNGAGIYVPNIQIQDTSVGAACQVDVARGGRITFNGVAMTEGINCNFTFGGGFNCDYFCFDTPSASITFSFQFNDFSMKNVAGNANAGINFGALYSRPQIKNLNFRMNATSTLNTVELLGSDGTVFEFCTFTDHLKANGSTSRGGVNVISNDSAFYECAFATAGNGLYYARSCDSSYGENLLFNGSGKRGVVPTTKTSCIHSVNGRAITIKGLTELPAALGGIPHQDAMLYANTGCEYVAVAEAVVQADGFKDHIVRCQGKDTLVADVTIMGQLLSRTLEPGDASRRLTAKNIRFDEAQTNTTASLVGTQASYDHVSSKGYSQNATAESYDARSIHVHMTEDFSVARIAARMSPDVNGNQTTILTQTGQIMFPGNNRLYIFNVGDSVEYECAIHGGVIGITNTGSQGTATNHYDIEMTMRRENETYLPYQPFTTANAQALLASLAVDPDNRIQIKYRITKNALSTTAYLRVIWVNVDNDVAYSSPYVFNPVDLNLYNIVPGSIVRIEAQAGGPLAPGELIHQATIGAGGTLSVQFSFQSDQPILVTIRKGTAPPYYCQIQTTGTIRKSGYELVVNQELD